MALVTSSSVHLWVSYRCQYYRTKTQYITLHALHVIYKGRIKNRQIKVILYGARDDETKALRCRKHDSSSTLNILRLKIDRLSLKLMRAADNKLHQEQFYRTTLCNRSLGDLNNVVILVASLFVLIIFKAQPKIELLN